MQERIGNFIIEQLDGWIEVRTVSRNWRMAWGEGTFMYGLALMLHSKGELNLFEPVIVASYIAGTVPLDGEALNEIFTSINDYALRNGLDLEAMNSQSDEEILEELKTYHNAKEATEDEEES